jgi:hypothetical protein
LVDGDDANSPGFGRAAELHSSAFHLDASAVRSDHSAENIEASGLAGPVAPHEGVNLTGRQSQRDFAASDDARKGPRNPL